MHDFIFLDKAVQAVSVFEQGVLIAERELIFYRVLLYQVDSFYVEVFFHKKENNIHKLRPFVTMDLLNPYLNQIDLTGLL